MKLALALVASALAFASARLPVFPQQWTAEVTDGIILNQGGQPGPDGSTCCPYEAPECKVQTEFQVGKMYYDFTNNRTAFLSPSGGGVVTLWNLGKEFEVSANGACEGWCPTQGTMQPFGQWNNTVDLGPTTYKGAKVEEYKQTEGIPILNITMETLYWYVELNSGSGYDTPVAQVTDITPFGQQLGQSTQTWREFTPGAPPASVFTVTGIDTCKKAQCSSGDGDGSSSSAHEDGAWNRVLKANGAAEFAAAALAGVTPPGYSEPSMLLSRKN